MTDADATRPPATPSPVPAVGAPPAGEPPNGSPGGGAASGTPPADGASDDSAPTRGGPPGGPPADPAVARRPLVERIGMAAIAAIVALLFGGVAAISFASGELFLAIMGAVGALMVAWVGVLTLVRG